MARGSHPRTSAMPAKETSQGWPRRDAATPSSLWPLREGCQLGEHSVGRVCVLGAGPATPPITMMPPEGPRMQSFGESRGGTLERPPQTVDLSRTGAGRQTCPGRRRAALRLRTSEGIRSLYHRKAAEARRLTVQRSQADTRSKSRWHGSDVLSCHPRRECAGMNYTRSRYA